MDANEREYWRRKNERTKVAADYYVLLANGMATGDSSYSYSATTFAARGKEGVNILSYSAKIGVRQTDINDAI